MCYDATDGTDVCLAGMPVKSSVHMGNGRDTGQFAPMMLPGQIERLHCSWWYAVSGMWISGAFSPYSQGCRNISIESHSFPAAAMPCHIASHL